MNNNTDKRIGVIGRHDGWSSRKLADAFETRTGHRCLIEMDNLAFDLERGTVCHGSVDLATLDALVVKKIGAAYSPDLLDRMEILRFLRSRGVRIFSEPDSMILAMDRISCTVTLRLGEIPIPPTTITENADEAVKAIERYGRAILKPVYTSKARGMIVVESGNGVADAVGSFQQGGNPIMYIQKMVPLPGRDLGLVFLGGKYVGTYARVGDGASWNTTTRSGGRYEPFEPASELIDLADRAQQLFKLAFTCVDVAETPDGPVVFEVSAFGGFRGLLEAREIDAAELYADYVLGELSA
ncbi:GAK system ATP-grasp enzyme [candidate division GN15 bacterium]|nr:GAK system ATP-grasp enzyme [candidate division GN15 bacterium]